MPLLNIKISFLSKPEELDDSCVENTNLLSIRDAGLSSSFKNLELDADSLRGSEESIDSLDSLLDEHQKVSGYSDQG